MGAKYRYREIHNLTQILDSQLDDEHGQGSQLSQSKSQNIVRRIHKEMQMVIAENCKLQEMFHRANESLLKITNEYD